MATCTTLSRIASATLLALLFSTPPLHAQGTSSDTKAGASSSKAGTASVSDDDRKIMEDIAQANIAEIQTGHMALEKGQSDQVKKFAQQMIDDHTKAQKQLQQLAQSKGVDLPGDTDLEHKAIATALKALSGDTFDNQYIARVGVGDHQRTRDLLQKAQKNAKDPGLKAYAQKTVKVVDGHLAMAKKMDNSKNGKK